MQTIQEILNFSVGKLTVGNIIFAIAIFIVCHMVIKALMGPINKLLDNLSFDKTLRTFLQAAIRVILNFVAVCIVAESVGRSPAVNEISTTTNSAKGEAVI